MKKWIALILLCLAQFIMVLDSTVMNVSISAVVADLGTTVAGLQAAITFYTLTMAALMLTGGKLGGIWGRRRAFKIGLAVYGLGSLITALSPNLATLLVGWSVIEGLGAVLVIPAIAALVAVNYSAKDRVVAFSAIGAISGVAAALGPLIGGLMTTYASWRYVFAGETVIVIIVLFFTAKILDEKLTEKVTIDWPSVALSALGMSALVFGMLQSKVWGWVKPLNIPEINGVPVAPFGISIVTYLILIGVITLIVFYNRQLSLIEHKRPPFVDVTLLKIKELKSGLSVLLSQYMITAAVFFVIPVYLQMVLGYDALKTGVRILPLSFAVIICSILGTRLLARLSVRQVVRLGQLCLVVGSIVTMFAIDAHFEPVTFGIGMFIIGGGLGFLASQIGAVNMAAVPEESNGEVGGLQGTYQNLGSSLGTALIGSVLIASLTAGFITNIEKNPDIPQDVKSYITEKSANGIQIVSSTQVEDYAESKGLPPDQAEAVAVSYNESQLAGLEESMLFVAFLALLSVVLSRNIPNQKPKAA